MKANLTEVCSGCSKLSSHLISCAGDRLCATCRAVIWAALVLLNRGVADEDTIIPTMVFAKVAGGSPKYAALVEERLPAVDIPGLMREARGQSTDGTKDEYAGWDLVTILDGVPIVRIRPMALQLEDHAETMVLKRVEVQVISRHVEPETVREAYERALRERDARWSENRRLCPAPGLEILFPNAKSATRPEFRVRPKAEGFEVEQAQGSAPMFPVR